MEIYSYWFLLALLLLGLEMATGTFYLLMLSIAMVVGGLAAMLALSMIWQLSLCALAVILGAIILRRWKKGLVNEVAGTSLDVGHPVQVLTWHENGSVRVLYRGAEWDAEPESADMPRDGTFYIKAVRGSSLVLTHLKP
ncbi:MAG: NfeD family protein [Gallionella sp.]|jgi:membrane protein implicated in regulation of membrane protease activity